MAIGPLGDLGPCIISWDGTPIGSIITANFRFSATFADVKEGEHGTTPVDSVFTGYDPCEFETDTTRVTYANLTSMIPGASNSGGESGNIQVFSNRVGTAMYASAAELIVKRIVNGAADSDQQYWLHFPKAYPVPQLDTTYDESGQRMYKILWKCFPDSSNSDLVWHIGDIT